jgi:hypothetical protein
MISGGPTDDLDEPIYVLFPWRSGWPEFYFIEFGFVSESKSKVSLDSD